MITTKQAATELGISDSRVRALCRAGRIDAVQMGRDWLIASLDSVRNRPPGRPKTKDSKTIALAEVPENKGLTATRKKTSRKLAK